MDEKTFLKRLKRGDEAALIWFIERYGAYVNTIIYHIIGATMSPADIEEVASDVFFALWTNAERIQPDKVKAYLGAVARNKAKNYTRKIRKEIPLEDDVIIVSDENIEQTFEHREQVLFLKKTIMALPCPDREIFLRHYYYYQPIAVIAEEMDMNASTVKTKLHRGRKKLKEIIIKGGYRVENENF